MGDLIYNRVAQSFAVLFCTGNNTPSSIVDRGIEGGDPSSLNRIRGV